MSVETSLSCPFSSKRTPVTCPSLISISVTIELKRTSPPRLITCSLILLTVSFKRSVPIWGLLKYIISGGAPACTNSLSTFILREFFCPIFNLPSEKAPAPPSPNCTLVWVSRIPVRQNFNTFLLRLSTSSPRSSRMGLAPAWARIKAANIPAGPQPTTTGRSFSFLSFGTV
ncbi:hypothetical protein UF75_4312 [Desulfosporosinus sp. I2]|nr:hypothetical protein UF75_4312 [Desulfosporosinus sp. I2]